VVAVLVIVTEVRTVVAGEVAGEDGFVELDIAGVGVWLAFAGVTALESYAVYELECGFSVAGCNCGALIGFVDALGDADFVAAVSDT
jgi:hypothetical protein